MANIRQRIENESDASYVQHSKIRGLLTADIKANSPRRGIEPRSPA